MMARQSQLTQQQEDFCNIYVRYPNATRAAVEVGSSHASARKQGYRLLRDEAVLARIAELRADMVRRHCRGTATLLAKLEALYQTAFAGQYYNAAIRAPGLQTGRAHGWESGGREGESRGEG